MRRNIRVIIVLIMLAIAFGIAAFPNLLPPGFLPWNRNDDASPKAYACRDEAIKKFPNDMQSVGSTPDGTGKSMVNRNAGAFSEAYAACMKR